MKTYQNLIIIYISFVHEKLKDNIKSVLKKERYWLTAKTNKMFRCKKITKLVSWLSLFNSLLLDGLCHCNPCFLLATFSSSCRVCSYPHTMKSILYLLIIPLTSAMVLLVNISAKFMLLHRHAVENWKEFPESVHCGKMFKYNVRID